METLMKLTVKYQGRISAMAGPLAEAVLWKKMMEACQKSDPGFSESGRLTGCGCTWESLAVRADGIYVPCCMLSHIELGRISKDLLQDVWSTSPGLIALRKRAEIPLDDFGFCSGCDYIPYCTGNCPGLAYSLTGELNHPSPDACLRNFMNDVKRETVKG